MVPKVLEETWTELLTNGTTNGPIPINTADPLAVPIGGTVTIESTGATVK